MRPRKRNSGNMTDVTHDSNYALVGKCERKATTTLSRSTLAGSDTVHPPCVTDSTSALQKVIRRQCGLLFLLFFSSLKHPVVFPSGTSSRHALLVGCLLDPLKLAV